MIAVVVPVHNEEHFLPSCLLALKRAGAHPALRGESVLIVVVLDDCSDRSTAIAASSGCNIDAIQIRAKSVGAARAAGARHALAAGARWLASTDADTIVATDWIACQLAVRAQAVCGTVTVRDWQLHHARVRHQFDARYRDVDGHRHVHGANLGICANAYVRAGGFKSLRTSEDVALVASLSAAGIAIAWSAKPRVATSARIDARAPAGFAAHIRALDDPR